MSMSGNVSMLSDYSALPEITVGEFLVLTASLTGYGSSVDRVAALVSDWIGIRLDVRDLHDPIEKLIDRGFMVRADDRQLMPQMECYRAVRLATLSFSSAIAFWQREPACACQQRFEFDDDVSGQDARPDQGGV
jgi:hypothetical protein